jgi:hypothetical protein
MKADSEKAREKCPKKEKQRRKTESVVSIEAGNQRAILKGMRGWDPAPYSPRQFVYL